MIIIAQVDGSGVVTDVPGPDPTRPVPAVQVTLPQLPEIDKSATNAIWSPAKSPPPSGAPTPRGSATLPPLTVNFNGVSQTLPDVSLVQVTLQLYVPGKFPVPGMISPLTGGLNDHVPPGSDPLVVPLSATVTPLPPVTSK